jgi:hypothetical protein
MYFRRINGTSCFFICSFTAQKAGHVFVECVMEYVVSFLPCLYIISFTTRQFFVNKMTSIIFIVMRYLTVRRIRRLSEPHDSTCNCCWTPFERIFLVNIQVDASSHETKWRINKIINLEEYVSMIDINILNWLH